MNYLTETKFVTVNGKSFRIEHVKATDKTTEEATVGEVLHYVLINYQPQIFQVCQRPPLNNKDLRCLNRALSVLEGEPQEEDGKRQYAFESQDWEVVRNVVDVLGPILLVRNSPALEDCIQAD
ncbi:hypothetical protein MYX75_01010 [Acidobacteria bacterium AH-259-A15]|nr:hypothetical protein [Acidobacteria bacterium AH-259-A15]